MLLVSGVPKRRPSREPGAGVAGWRNLRADWSACGQNAGERLSGGSVEGVVFAGDGAQHVHVTAQVWIVGDDDARDRCSAIAPERAARVGHRPEGGVVQVDPCRDDKPSAGKADQDAAFERAKPRARTARIPLGPRPPRAQGLRVGFHGRCSPSKTRRAPGGCRGVEKSFAGQGCPDASEAGRHLSPSGSIGSPSGTPSSGRPRKSADRRGEDPDKHLPEWEHTEHARKDRRGRGGVDRARGNPLHTGRPRPAPLIADLEGHWHGEGRLHPQGDGRARGDRLRSHSSTSGEPTARASAVPPPPPTRSAPEPRASASPSRSPSRRPATPPPPGPPPPPPWPPENCLRRQRRRRPGRRRSATRSGRRPVRGDQLRSP